MSQPIFQQADHHQAETIPSTRHLTALINKDPILANYFRRANLTQGEYWRLAHELMLDGLRYRAQVPTNDTSVNPDLKSTLPKATSPQQNKKPEKAVQLQKTENNPKKHYNVAYIKHNRFLSPKQRKDQVAPKVTEVIPQSPPHVIYGKPKVKVDQNYGCPYHYEETQCLESSPYIHSPPKATNSSARKIHQVHIRQSQVFPEQSKSPATECPFEYQKKNSKKTKQEETKPQKKTKNSTILVDKIVSVKSRKPGMVRVVSPDRNRHADSSEDEEITVQINGRDEYLTSKYAKAQPKKKYVQSKIKYLIDRDKRNKALQKNLEKQDQRIRKLEQALRQNKTKAVVRLTEHDIISLSSDTSMSMMETKVVDQFKQKQMENRFSTAKPSFPIHAQDQFQSDDDDEEVDCSCSQTFEEGEEDRELSSSSLSDEESFPEFRRT